MLSTSAAITLAVLLAAIVVFIGGWLAPEFVALSAAGLLIAGGVLSPGQALAGFGSPALITLMGMFVLAEGLLHSGALDRLRELLASPRIRTPQQLTGLLVAVVAPLSGVIPNTPIVAILLPVLQSWCRRRGISPSRVLIPLAFATITGGTFTLIGTSSNLLASEVSAKLGHGEFQLFSFTAVGIPVWLLGSAYLLLASRCLPQRGHDLDAAFLELSRQGYLTEVLLPAGSQLTGTSLRELRFRQRFNATVLAVKRANTTLQAPLDTIRGLQQNSELVVLDELDSDLPSTHRKGLALVTMGAVLLLSGLQLIPLVAAVLLGVAALVVGNCLDASTALQQSGLTQLAGRRRPARLAAGLAGAGGVDGGVRDHPAGHRAAEQRRHRGAAAAGGGQAGRGAWPAAAAVHLHRGVRRQPELPLADRLSDQPDGVRPRQLPLPRLPALRLAALAALRPADSLAAAAAQPAAAREPGLRASLTFPHAPDTGVHR